MCQKSGKHGPCCAFQTPSSKGCPHVDSQWSVDLVEGKHPLSDIRGTVAALLIALLQGELSGSNRICSRLPWNTTMCRNIGNRPSVWIGLSDIDPMSTMQSRASTERASAVHNGGELGQVVSRITSVPHVLPNYQHEEVGGRTRKRSLFSKSGESLESSRSLQSPDGLSSRLHGGDASINPTFRGPETRLYAVDSHRRSEKLMAATSWGRQPTPKGEVGP